MTFPFDLVSPAPAVPAISGSASSSARKSGGFAEALAAVQPDAAVAALPSGEVVAPGAIVPPRLPEGSASGFGAPDLAGLDQVIAGNVAPTTDPEDIAAPVDGTEIAAAPVSVEPNLVAAPLVPTAAAAPTQVPPAGDGAEMDLPRAGASMPGLPEISGDVPGLGSGDDAPLIEGRASASGAAPAAPPVSGDVPEAPSLTRQQIAAAMPRAVADEPVTKTATAVPDAHTPSPPDTIIPEAARQAATTPHVTSLQAKVTATPADASADMPDSVAGTLDASAGGADNAEPVSGAKPVAIPAPEDNLEADVKTRAKAADGALDVLTKDKAETRPVPTQPVPAAEDAPVDDVRAAREPARPDEAVVKTEAKPQAEPEKAKPLAAEKVQVPEERPAPQPVAMTDRPVVHEAAKAHQVLQTLPAAVLPHIASEMASRVKQGTTQFEIRLDPPELGRVDVRVEIDSDGRVVSRLTVEKTETLDLLKADQRALERALQDAGFKADQNSLSFSLRDERGNGQAKFEDQPLMREHSGTNETEEEPARLAAEIAYRAALRGPGGLDLTV